MRDKKFRMLNDLVGFLYKADCQMLRDACPKELRAFLDAGNTLRDVMEKNIRYETA